MNSCNMDTRTKEVRYTVMHKRLERYAQSMYTKQRKLHMINVLEGM